MLLANKPDQIVLPVASASGAATAIPVASQIGITDGAASYTDGFPPLTRTPKAAGGVPPRGLEMNGVLKALSSIDRWSCAGGGYPFNSTFANDSNVGGYPKGARVLRSDGAGYWINTTDNNVTDPENVSVGVAAAAGWYPDLQTGTTEVTMTNTHVTLTPAQYGKLTIVISGTLASNVNLIFPDIAGQWVLINNTAGGYTITAKTSGGTGVNIEATTPVFGDGVNIYSDSHDFLQSGAGAVSRTATSKLRDAASISDFAALGDGSTLEQTEVDNAIASGFSELLAPDGKKFLVTSFTNVKGVEINGGGSVVKAVSGGLQKINSYSDDNQRIFGTEYLAAFHNLLIAQSTTPTRKPIMVFSGDSTTAGDGVSADYQIDDLMGRAAQTFGLQTAYGVTSHNRGQSGVNTEQWRVSHLAGDLALTPDLLVLRWGINDPGWLKNGTAPAIDSGQDFPNRRDALDMITSLRAGLTTIRGSRDLASLSIIIMSPNSTNDVPNARDALYYEQLIPMLKQASRDFNCCFIDTYALWRDSTVAHNIWMDDPMPTSGHAIHPLNVMNLWITGVMLDVIFPIGLRNKIGVNAVRNIGGAEDAGDEIRLPSYYNKGVTVSRALTGFPIDGSVVTISSQDDTAMQILYPYKDADRGSAKVRFGATVANPGSSAIWGGWNDLILASGTVNVTPEAGYEEGVGGTGAMRAAKIGHMVTIEGFILKTTPSVLSPSTTIGTIPAGYRPVREPVYHANIAIYTDVGGFEYKIGRIMPNGAVILMEGTAGNVARVYINASWSTLA
jgi:hypothetical protein